MRERIPRVKTLLQPRGFAGCPLDPFSENPYTLAERRPYSKKVGCGERSEPHRSGKTSIDEVPQRYVGSPHPT